MGLSADLGQLTEELKRVDKKFASAVRKQVRAAVAEAGAGIVEKVREEASWSSRIPAATTLRVNFSAKSAGVRIVTNRRKAPHARPYEFGNLSASTLVNGTGGQMPTRPFFFAAVAKMDKPTEEIFQRAIEDISREAGFR